MLQDLNLLGTEAKLKCSQFNKSEFELSEQFKEEFKVKIIGGSIEYKKYTFIVKTSSDLEIIAPNQWLVIASYFTPFLKAVKEYKLIIDKLGLSKEKVEEYRKDKILDEDIKNKISKISNLITDQQYISRFLTDYDWWFGSKTIDRSDYFVSSILKLASVVNSTQSYIAELTNILSDNENLIVILNKDLDKLINKRDKIILEDKILKFAIFESFKYCLKNYGEEKVLAGHTIKESTIEDRKFSGLMITKYFNSDNLIGMFETNQSADSLKSGITQRFIENNINILGNENSYFTTQWNYKDSKNLNLKAFNLFLKDVSNNQLEISKENEIYKLVFKKIEENENRNLILYGPPGTGKTYNSINRALSIIKGNNLIGLSREQIKIEFDKCVESGQIDFVTFHQSFSYEEFVEGIKPITKENGEKIDIEYKIQDGVFKKLCLSAQKTKNLMIEIDGVKQELSINKFEEFYYSFSEQLPDQSEKESDIKLKTKEQNVFQLFKNSVSSIVVKAGEKQTPSSVSCNELIKVLFEDKQPVYKSYEQIIIDKILEGKNFEKLETTNENKPYILIIDEINRGNISKIFGELITLIEDSKRIGSKEELKLKLTYSGVDDNAELFGVPNNVYIIGTMNTADRSITNIDTALRRRFVFEEFPPIHDHPSIKSVTHKDGNEINLQNVLKVMNERIEYLLDRDHLIGHAYFLNIESWEMLCDKFRNNIIPLLQEYFYNDWEKIALVLGDNSQMGKVDKDKFIQTKKRNTDFLFGKGNSIEDEINENAYFLNSDLVNKNYEELSSQFFIKGFPKLEKIED